MRTKVIVFNLIEFETSSLAAVSRSFPYCTWGIGYSKSNVIENLKKNFVESLEYRVNRAIERGQEPLISEREVKLGDNHWTHSALSKVEHVYA